MNDSIKLSWPATSGFWEVAVLYEDEHLLALNKPVGLPTEPDPQSPERPSLLSLLHEGIREGKPWSVKRGLSYLMTADQVDSEATGLILLARSKEVLVSLANLFGSEKPLRKYVTLVQGSPSEERFEVDAKLANDPVRAGLMRIEPHHGKRARTLFSVRERFAGWTLLDCEPLTVRKHQVRVHLRYKRLRVAGDLAYGGNPLLLSNLKSAYHLKPGKTERPLLSQPGLHAERLELPHPVSGAALTLVAPWPKDLSVAVKYLRRYAAPAAG